MHDILLVTDRLRVCDRKSKVYRLNSSRISLLLLLLA